MEPRTLSSAWTFWHKFVFPALWVGIWVPNMVGLLLGEMRDRDNAPPPELIRWLFLVVGIAVTVFIFRACARLKRVRTDRSAIYVSNYFQEIRIPNRTIARVTTSRWSRRPVVSIRLRTPTVFGDRIAFVSKQRLVGWRYRPILGNLRQFVRGRGR